MLVARNSVAVVAVVVDAGCGLGMVMWMDSSVMVVDAFREMSNRISMIVNFRGPSTALSTIDCLVFCHRLAAR